MTTVGHGTFTRAIHQRCQCKPCTTYRIRRAYDRSRGIPARVDAEQPRAHVERLVARGWSYGQIAAATGLDQTTMSVILSGRYQRVDRRTAEAILNVRLNQPPPVPRGLTDATGTRRRLQALMVLGYTLPDISRRTGVGASSLHQTVNGRWARIRTGTADRVARVYRDLSTRPAPATTRAAEQARNEAMTRGWHGPMAWADIDDPACQPEPEQLTAPQHVHADDIAELAARGFSDAEIARRLDRSERTVLRARIAHQIPAGVTA